MTDIFDEVNEDLRHERYKALWRRFGKYVIALAVLIVIFTAGYRGWQSWQISQAASAGDAFMEALALSEDDQHIKAETALNDLIADSHGGYPALARFRIASEAYADGEIQKAQTAFEALGKDAHVTQNMQMLARLRAGFLGIDSGKIEEAVQNLGSLAEGSTVWRHLAREVIGLTAWKGEQVEEAHRWYKMIVDDFEAPRDIRERANMALAVVASTVGTVHDKTKAEVMTPSAAQLSDQNEIKDQIQ